MIICKMLDPPDDHLQGAGPSERSFARGQSLRMIICKRRDPLDDHLQQQQEQVCEDLLYYLWWTRLQEKSGSLVYWQICLIDESYNFL